MNEPRACSHCGAPIYLLRLVGAGWTGERVVPLDAAVMCYEALGGGQCRAKADVLPLHRCAEGLGALSPETEKNL